MSIFKSNESSDVVKKTIWDRDGGSSDAIALIGGGNVGKETLLEGLTKNIPYEKSYPETSVLMQYGRIAGSKQPIFNVPGDLLFSSASDGEFIAKRIFFEERANKIIFVADAKNLKASLAHFLYCSEFGLPMIFNVNMIDQAQLQGIEIDLPKLEQLLGTKVHTTIGIERMGVNQLRDLLDGQLPEAHSVLYPEVLDNYLSMFSKLLPDAGVGVKQLALSLLVGDKFATKYFEQKFSSEQRQTVNSLISSVKSQFSREISNYLFDIYHNRAEEIYGQVVTTKERSYSLSLEGKFGIWSRNLTTGIPIAVVIIAAMFFIVGRFGAEWLVGWTEGVFFGEILNPMVEGWLATINTPFLTDMIVGEFGLLSVGITLPIGLVGPVLLTFYFCFNLLESSGYLPRLAILFDRLFKKMGMSGKGVIPLIMGFSCITMAIITTRLLDTNRERNMATLLLLGIPCAPLFGMIMVLLAAMPASAYLAVFGIIFLRMLLVGFVSNKLFRHQESNFLMSVPPLVFPSVLLSVKAAFRQSYAFLKEALPVFLYATFAVFLLDQVGGITFIENICKPILNDWIGLPVQSTSVFIMSFIRREAGVALLKQFVDAGIFNNVQIIINLLLISFLVPCINAVIVIVKERGWKIAVSFSAFTIVFAIVMGSVLNFSFQYFNVTF